jgi:hypothetical protein
MSRRAEMLAAADAIERAALGLRDEVERLDRIGLGIFIGADVLRLRVCELVAHARMLRQVGERAAA